MEADRSRRFEPWPFFLAGGLLAMIAGSLAFYAIARANPDALVARDAYEAGLRYHAQEAERRAAAALGVDVDLRAAPDEAGVTVRVDLRGADGAPVAAERVVVRRERPAEGGYDRDFPLAADGDAFAGAIPLPRPGRWHLAVAADVEGHTLRRTFRVSR